MTSPLVGTAAQTNYFISLLQEITGITGNYKLNWHTSKRGPFCDSTHRASKIHPGKRSENPPQKPLADCLQFCMLLDVTMESSSQLIGHLWDSLGHFEIPLGQLWDTGMDSGTTLE